MAVFEVRTLGIPLFGVVERKNREEMRKKFSTGGNTRRIEIDDSTYAMLARELRLETRELVRLARRYTDGEFFVGTAGLGGTCLGDFGELLTFLVNRAEQHEIVRVVSYSAMGKSLKGNKFPQPDFIVETGSRQFALEVKSTEAFDFLNLGNISTWRGVHACRGIPEMRAAALQQLGYVDNKRKAQTHHLKLLTGKPVPFPATGGQAVAVLVHDGRVRRLRSDARYKAPSACRSAKSPRSCWSCVTQNQAAIMVTMSNEPGYLTLFGENREGWLAAYARWTSALLAAEPVMVRAAVNDLITVTSNWLSRGVPKGPRYELAVFWARYLVVSHALHGVRAPFPHHLFRDSDAGLAEREDESQDAPEPAQEISIERARQAILESRSARLHLSFGDRGDARWRISVRRNHDGWRFTLGAEEWWARRVIGDPEAGRLCLQLINTVLELIGFERAPAELGEPVMRRLVVSVDDKEVFCGWEPRPWVTNTVEPQSIFWIRWLFEPPFFLSGPLPRWVPFLYSGDPRVRLYVHPDGRADLNIADTVPLVH